MAALLGFLIKAEVDAGFRQQPFETEGGIDPRELWRQLQERVQVLPPLQPGTIEVLPDSTRATVEEIRARKTFKEHYEGVADYTFVAVPIDSLLTPQWVADLDFVDEISTRLKPKMTVDEQLLFALSEGRITEPIVTANQVTFTSQKRDLFAQPIPIVRELGQGEFEIVIKAAARPNYIQVARIGNRLLLTNGVHKVCALSRAGYSHCSCIMRTTNDILEAGFDPRSSSLFRDTLFFGARPALVLDFLNPQLTGAVRIRSMYQILQVAVNVGTMTVPALPER